MTRSIKNIVSLVLDNLIALSAGKSMITEEAIKNESDPVIQELQMGFLCLQEELALKQQTIDKGVKLAFEREEKLRQAQKMEAIGRLAGGIAHDFNNILTVLLITAADLIHESANSHVVLDKLRIIESSGNRAALLTRQLLAFSRQEVIRPTMLSLEECVASTLLLLTRTLGEDIKIIFTHEKTPKVMLDAGQVAQMLINLAINARDAMPAGGKLTIEVANRIFDEAYVANHEEAAVGPHVMLSVSDTGTGIDNNILDKIFDPFFTTKSQGKGTGLGLSTVLGAVKQNGGSIEVYSEVGCGATFKLYFPVKQNIDHHKSQTIVKAGSKVEALNITVLLVEDMAELRAVVSKMLEDFGCTVIVAENGKNALDKYGKHKSKIDLLLTDVVMPQMNGKELAEQLKKLQPNVRCIFMSGYTEDIVADRGVIKKDVLFLEKPFTKKALLAIILEALN